ncbi:neuraminidase-like domain-containing protein [Nonomuraea wenchangensis]|uniref:Tc toxin subunit A-related protein n=1 Tax=Nonomuraea wenchangensis TaxID=568860 RepID=UPI00384D3B3C
MLDAYAAAVAAPGTVGERRAAALAVLAGATGVDEALVASAADQVFLFGLTYYDALGLAALADLVTALIRLGATPAQVPLLIGVGTTAEQDAQGAELARTLLRSRYGDALWGEVLRPVSDRLRLRQRDTLTDFLVHREGLRGPEELYRRFLVDVLVAPCADTTRLLAATAAVQLFVDRCLLGLEEPTVPAASINRGRWEWIGAYRVWEANRRVFIWPQNWLYPELREDASPAFRAVESALAQQEPSEHGARQALLAYLDDLVELSRLAVVGMYQHRRGALASGGSDLYLVARTPDRPYRYFWRVCEDFGGSGVRWRPWKRVELDVSGTHVMPFVLEGDLHLAWPVFRRNQVGGVEVWEIQLACARHTGKGWSEQIVGRDTVAVPVLVNKDEAQTVTFSLTVVPEPPVTTTDASLKLIDRTIEQAAVVTLFRAGNIDDPLVPRVLPEASSDNGRIELQLTLRALATQAGLSSVAHWRAAGAVALLTCGEGAFAAEVTLATGADGELSVLIDPSYFRLPMPYAEIVLLPAFLAGQFRLEVSYADLPPQTIEFSKEAANLRAAKRWSVDVVFTLPSDAPVPPQVADPERRVTWSRYGSFVITARGGVRWQLNRGPQLYRKLSGGAQHENGVLEVAGGARPVFDSLRRFDSAPGRFFALPANPQEGSRLLEVNPREADAVHYRDGAGQYLIQILSGDRWRIVADGLPLATRLRNDATGELSALFSPAVQGLADGGSTLQEIHRPQPAPEPDSITARGVDFASRSPSGLYHWELFLHVPMLIAQHLSAQQRYAAADRWLRLVFDPTAPGSPEETPGDPGRFWRFLPFRTGGRPDRIEDLLAWLANPQADFPGRADFMAQIARWRDDPFRPHEIARMRPSAYRWDVLFAYLDNLIAWGDDRFRRDTRESLVEATMLYVRAVELLGPRPQRNQPQFQPPTLTYRAMAGRWDDFANVWYSLADSPLVAAMLEFMRWLEQHGVVGPAGAGGGADALAALASVGATYFCVPHNERLLEYWSTVEDRLFKIRNCRNIDGVERRLPLYEPPIDPDLLVRAVAAGVDIEAAVRGVAAPLSQYRYTVLASRAAALCAEVRALGGEVLAAQEKRDAEHLARLRAEQEVSLLELAEDVRAHQVAEAQASVDALLASRESAAARYRHYQYLLTGGQVQAPPEQTTVIEEPSRLRPARQDGLDPDALGLGLLQAEADQLDWQAVAGTYAIGAGVANTAAGVLFALAAFWGPLANLGHASNAVGSFLKMLSDNASQQAGRSGAIAGFQRRADDWLLQSNTALRELVQIDKQLAAARIRLAVTELELASHRRQIVNARDVAAFMRAKHTNEELFIWMSGQLGEVQLATYRLTVDIARQAERAYRSELCEPDAVFIRSDHWDGARGGLLAGQRLAQDLRRMDAAYHERNRREHEMTRHVSLRLLNPMALLELRATGRCEFTIPEQLFDTDFPGHYLRRLKSLALTLPCVAGPYTPVHARMTLLWSTIRHRADGGSRYEREGDEDTRFSDDLALSESVVTSGTVDATGVWEPSLRDERRMPSEGRGAICRIRLELPGDYRQFDYDTIADAVLTLRYSARDGGDALRDAAVAALHRDFAKAIDVPKAILISLRHDFPSEWARFTAATSPDPLIFTVTSDRFPVMLTGAAISVTRVDMLTAVRKGTAPAEASPVLATPAPDGGTPIEQTATVEPDPIGHLRAAFVEGLAIPLATDREPAGWTLTASAEIRQTLRDVTLVLTYRATTLAAGSPNPPG